MVEVVRTTFRQAFQHFFLKKFAPFSPEIVATHRNVHLPTFDTLLWNSQVRLHNQLQACNNALISQLQLL